MELIINYHYEKNKLDTEIDQDKMLEFDDKFNKLLLDFENINIKDVIENYKKTTFNKINQWEYVLENIHESNDDFKEFNELFEEYDIDFCRIIFYEFYKIIYLDNIN
tara:strand:- start:190 stop:510 length:321 start_codon:yes stop_codon:yes gene_type:complete